VRLEGRLGAEVGAEEVLHDPLHERVLDAARPAERARGRMGFLRQDDAAL
jgi:hypothetical protein